MMSWNHRILRHLDDRGVPWYVLHEVYYTDGDIDCWTEKETAPFGETFQDLRKGYKLMGLAFEKPVLEEYEDGATTKLREVSQEVLDEDQIRFETQ